MMLDIDYEVQKYFQCFQCFPNPQSFILKDPFETIHSTATQITQSLNTSAITSNLQLPDFVDTMSGTQLSDLTGGVYGLQLSDLTGGAYGLQLSALTGGAYGLQVPDLTGGAYGLQLPDLAGAIQPLPIFTDATALKNILSETSSVLKQYQGFSHPDYFNVYEAAISILDINIQQITNISAASYQEQIVDLSGKEKLISYVTQHQEILSSLINELSNKPSQKEQNQVLGQLSQEISVGKIINLLCSLINTLAAIKTLYPDAVQYIYSKLEWIDLIIQLIIVHVFFLPF